jgi:hypothetical protein
VYQRLLEDASLLEALLKIDEDLAAQVREAGCEWCGGDLHSADYLRKSRGPWVLGDEQLRRFSLCCAVEGCRRRATPPSVRFLGRKVYLGAVVVLATALRHGPTPTRLARIRELWGVGVRTLMRWREWWSGAFGHSAFWRAARARFATPVAADHLPLSLVEAFGVAEGGRERLVDLLKWLSPLSRRKGLLVSLVEGR